MKILFVIDSLCGGGAERVVSILSSGFVSNSNNSVCIMLLFDNQIEYQILEEIEIFNVMGEKIPKTMLKKGIVLTSERGRQKELKKKTLFRRIREDLSEIRDVERRAKLLSNFVNKNCVDVVISFLDNSNQVACRAKTRMNPYTRLIISERNDPRSTWLSSRLGHRLQRLYCRADRVVFQTEEAMHCYPIKIQKKGCIIPNPISSTLPDKYEGVRRKEIVNFGRFNSQKNLQLLIKAFSKVKALYPDYRLHLYGKGSQREELEKLVHNLKLDENVEISPFKPDIHTLIRDAAMYVSSSDYEGISNAMLEALAIGLPCICTDCPAGGARMAITNGENGLLVPVRDEDALTKAMISLIENQNLAERLAKNATRIRNEWSPENISKMWLDEIKTLY